MVTSGGRSVRCEGNVLCGKWRLERLVHSGRCRIFRAAAVGVAEADFVVKMASQDPPDALTVAMLEREALVGSQVRRPSLAPVLDWRFRDAPPYLVRPWIPGRRAAALPARTLATALSLARRVAQAVESLHQCGWLHGDLSDRNILVDPAGHATLIDFGLSRRHASGELCLDDWLASDTASHPYGVATELRRLLRWAMESVQRAKPHPLQARVLRWLCDASPASASQCVDQLMRLELLTLSHQGGAPQFEKPLKGAAHRVHSLSAFAHAPT